jgi:hypothetical protein
MVPFSPGREHGHPQLLRLLLDARRDVTHEEADEFFREVEATLSGEQGGVPHRGQYIGFDGSFAQVQVFFESQTRGGAAVHGGRGRRSTTCCRRRPGWVKEARFGGSDGTEDEAFMVTLYGDDHQSVQDAKEASTAGAGQAARGARGVEPRGRHDAARRAGAGGRPDDDRALRGVGGAIANTVAYAIRGQLLPRFQSPRRTARSTSGSATARRTASSCRSCSSSRC